MEMTLKRTLIVLIFLLGFICLFNLQERSQYMKHVIREPNPVLRFTQTPTIRARTNRIILHHYHHSSAPPQEVHRWHLSNGWLGIGYNFMVDRDGTIWRGRGMDALGTHTANNNGDSIGIACQGRYDDHDLTMPDAQFNALIWLIHECRKVHGIIPVIGHRDASPSSCPGRFFPLAEVQKLEYRGVAPAQPPTQVASPAAGADYRLHVPLPGHMTAADALSGSNPRNTQQP